VTIYPVVNYTIFSRPSYFLIKVSTGIGLNFVEPVHSIFFQYEMGIRLLIALNSTLHLLIYLLETISSKKYIMRTNAFSSDESVFKFLGEV
jgi:hypothetical protein